MGAPLLGPGDLRLRILRLVAARRCRVASPDGTYRDAEGFLSSIVEQAGAGREVV